MHCFVLYMSVVNIAARMLRNYMWLLRVIRYKRNGDERLWCVYFEVWFRRSDKDDECSMHLYIYIWKSSHSYATFQLDIPIFSLAFYYGDEFINKLDTSAHLPTPMQVETIWIWKLSAIIENEFIVGCRVWCNDAQWCPHRRRWVFLYPPTAFVSARAPAK